MEFDERELSNDRLEQMIRDFPKIDTLDQARTFMILVLERTRRLVGSL